MPERLENNSWYFRNALVRANYNDLKNGVHATTKFLEQFFCNLLLGTKYELKNRYMHVDYVGEQGERNFQSASYKNEKCKNCTLECSLEEWAILKYIMENSSITQKELAQKLRKSERTIKTKVLLLQEKKYIRRVNGKRYGKWEVLVNIKPE